MRLTATTLRSLACPASKSEQTFFDDDLPGFGLRVRAGGAKTWVVQYAIAGKSRKIFLGSPGVVDPGRAREAAKGLLAAVRLGRDPAKEKAQGRANAAETFAALLPRFIDHQRARLRPRSFVEVDRHLNKHAKSLHSEPVERVDRRAIAKLLTEIAEKNGPGAANRTRGSLSAFFTWLSRAGYVESNPVSYTNKAIETGARSRVLSDAELGTIWRALGDDDYDVIVKLLMLTGCRRDEIGSLRWSEIDLEAATITLPPARTKNRRGHTIPLSVPALAILQARRRDDERDPVFGRGENRGFQNWSAPRKELDKRLTQADEALTGWTLHDFRRSISTAMHECFGVPPHVVEAVLGHVSGHQGGVAGVYNRSSYLEERRRALARWGEHVPAIVTGKSATGKIANLR